MSFNSIVELQAAMRDHRYIAEHGLATSLYLALKLGHLIFLEGEAGVGKTEVARLRSNCHQLIWLNPLLGAPDYQPLTRGIQAALPHIDNFLPVHNLASLEDLANRLANLDRRVHGGSHA